MAEMFKELDPSTMTRSPGLTYQELLDQDTHEVPAVLRLESPRDVGLNDFSIDRYITREYHDKEVANLWMKVWQFACREEEIPEPGDHMRYDIAGRSFLIVRQLDGLGGVFDRFPGHEDSTVSALRLATRFVLNSSLVGHLFAFAPHAQPSGGVSQPSCASIGSSEGPHRGWGAGGGGPPRNRKLRR